MSAAELSNSSKHGKSRRRHAGASHRFLRLDHLNLPGTWHQQDAGDSIAVRREGRLTKSRRTNSSVNQLRSGQTGGFTDLNAHPAGAGADLDLPSFGSRGQRKDAFHPGPSTGIIARERLPDGHTARRGQRGRSDHFHPWWRSLDEKAAAVVRPEVKRVGAVRRCLKETGELEGHVLIAGSGGESEVQGRPGLDRRERIEIR
jgi:hypothetical protein